MKTIKDYLSGEEIPNIGAEEARQSTARNLVEKLGFDKKDIKADLPIYFEVGEEKYSSKLDLVVYIKDYPVICLRTVAGNPGAAEREALAAARLVEGGPAIWAAVSDGKENIIIDAKTGIKEKDLPDKREAEKRMGKGKPEKMDQKRIKKERMIFRTYDMDRVNR